MKRICTILVLIWCVPGLSLLAGIQSLEPLESLKELPLQLVEDFSENENIASPALPVLNSKGYLFFYDYKLRRLCRVTLSNGKILQIGGFGEGPKEYTGISGLWTGGDAVYSMDRKGKLCRFDLEGTFLWGERLDKIDPRLLGMVDKTMFFQVFSRYSSKSRALRLFSWRKGGRADELLTLPVEFAATRAYADGKVLKGGGIIHISVPTLAVWNGMLVTSAYEDYRFDLRDSTGKLKRQVVVNAPAPRHSPRLETYSSVKGKKVYALREMYPTASYLAIVSNYYRDGKPRIDFFGPDGNLLKSFVLPFKADGGLNKITIQGEYLLYSDFERSGFKIYKIAVKI